MTQNAKFKLQVEGGDHKLEELKASNSYKKRNLRRKDDFTAKKLAIVLSTLTATVLSHTSQCF